MTMCKDYFETEFDNVHQEVEVMIFTPARKKRHQAQLLLCSSILMKR